MAGILSGAFNAAAPEALVTGKLRLPTGSQAIPEAKGTQDFFGLNYYTSQQVAFSLLRPGELFHRRFFPPDAEVSSSGFLANQPEGFYQAIQWALRYNLPILITENGVEDREDRLRPKYLIQHLHQLWRAVNFNFPVRGYFHWTLVDNFEWERGWSQRFGLWELDTATQVRSKRPSAELFAEICRENGLSSEMVARYAPELFVGMFPNE
jgi:beta-glucosidase